MLLCSVPRGRNRVVVLFMEAFPQQQKQPGSIKPRRSQELGRWSTIMVAGLAGDGLVRNSDSGTNEYQGIFGHQKYEWQGVFFFLKKKKKKSEGKRKEKKKR